MIAVIIAGGSGTRLWPLSTADYPKHLLRLTNDRSLLQNTYDRVQPLASNILVVSEKSHARHVYDQLPKVPRRNILIEPARRGTAACFILALSEIRRRQLDSEAIFFLWADHLVKNRQAFSSAIRQFAKIAESEEKLLFMGGQPTYPATGFNYIRKGKKLSGFSGVYRLKEFVEKPDQVTAERYFLSGDYLWNSGYLLGTLETFESEIEDYAPGLWQNYQKLLEQKLLKPFSFKKTYMEFPNEVIDDALSQKVKDALAVVTPFDWADVGSFHDLHGASAQDGEGNHLIGDKIELGQVSNSYVRNEQDLPIAVIGLDNVAVVATENGVLVTNKEHAQAVGDISKRIQAGNGELKWYEKL